MQCEVYADLLFMINFSMDFLCLFLTARILRCRLRILSALIASIIGGVYSIVTLLIQPIQPVSFLADVAVCAIMCAICFVIKKSTIKQYIQTILIYLICAAVLGGIMTALFNLMNRLDISINSGGDNISSWLFLLLAIISGISAVKSTEFIKKKSNHKISEAEIIFENKRQIFKGMTDTGNILKDPASGRSVIITDTATTASLLPKELYSIISNGSIEQLSLLPPQYYRRVRIIPSNTISGHNLLIGIIPDKILLHTNTGISDVSAIFAPAKLSDLPENCNAIIPVDLYK